MHREGRTPVRPVPYKMRIPIPRDKQYLERRKADAPDSRRSAEVREESIANQRLDEKRQKRPEKYRGYFHRFHAVSRPYNKPDL